MSENVDMHLHSDISDGSFGPIRLACLLKEQGILGGCLTDHDALNGTFDFQKECARLGLFSITGMEVSALHQDQYVHLLLYDVAKLVASSFFPVILQSVWQAHEQRTLDLLKQYSQQGLLEANLALIRQELQLNGPFVHFSKVWKYRSFKTGLTFEEVRSEAKSLGIAKPSINKGLLPKAETVIQMVKPSGCKIGLAHPGTITAIKNETNELAVNSFLQPFLAPLQKIGLSCLEVFHTKHNLVQERIFQSLAEKRGLLITGGSDFHGELTPKVKVGDKGLDLIAWHSFLKARI